MSDTTLQDATLYSLVQYEDRTMANRQMEGSSLRVGDAKTVSLAFLYASGANKGLARAVASAKVLVIDTNRPVSGTADSGSTTTIVATDLEQADDFWVGCPIIISIGENVYQTVVTGWDVDTHTLTFPELPEAVTGTSGYTLQGLVLIPQDDVTPTSNTVSLAISVADATASPGVLNFLWEVTFDDNDDVESYVVKVRVYANAYV